MQVPVTVVTSQVADQLTLQCSYPAELKSSAITSRLKKVVEELAHSDPALRVPGNRSTLLVELEDIEGSFEIKLSL